MNKLSEPFLLDGPLLNLLELYAEDRGISRERMLNRVFYKAFGAEVVRKALYENTYKLEPMHHYSVKKHIIEDEE